MSRSKRGGEKTLVARAAVGVEAGIAGGGMVEDLVCQYQVVDNHGRINCLACDGTVGYCDFKLCPRCLWQRAAMQF